MSVLQSTAEGTWRPWIKPFRYFTASIVERVWARLKQRPAICGCLSHVTGTFWQCCHKKGISALFVLKAPCRLLSCFASLIGQGRTTRIYKAIFKLRRVSTSFDVFVSQTSAPFEPGHQMNKMLSPTKYSLRVDSIKSRPNRQLRGYSMKLYVKRSGPRGSMFSPLAVFPSSLPPPSRALSKSL